MENTLHYWCNLLLLLLFFFWGGGYLELFAYLHGHVYMHGQTQKFNSCFPTLYNIIVASFLTYNCKICV